MATISNLLQRIDSLFTQSQVAFPMIPPILLQCGSVARPGLSAIREMQEATKKLSNAGIPIGPNLDGSPNMSLNFAWALINAKNEELLKNGQVQIAVPTPAGTVTLFGILV